MRSIFMDHPVATYITLVGDIQDPLNDNVDVWVDLRDGRRFSFTVFTLRNIESNIGDRLSFVSPGMLIVKELSDKAIIEVVTEAERLGMERCGVLQT